jgi:hypothetical protein
MGRHWKSTLLSLAIVLPAGLYSKRYHGPAEFWVNTSFDGVLYEIFWCLLLSLVFPRTRPRNLAVSVFTGTCVLEFLQLWHPPFLESWRHTFVGAGILGTTFGWSDFPYYLVGSALGWLWLYLLRRAS